MDTTYAYLAGTIDADGFITVSKIKGGAGGRTAAYYYPRVGLAEIHPVVPELLRDTFGGSIHIHTPANPRHRPWYGWRAEGPKAAAALRLLLPHLRLKRRQAELAIQLAERVSALASGHPKSAEEMAARAQIWREIGALNDPRNRRVHLLTAAE